MWKGRGAKRRCVLKEDHVVYIPVLETLQGLLKNEAILSGKRGCAANAFPSQKSSMRSELVL